ncbi:TetR/AcrR family transcriptional regulator [Piscicoccus intestinalis]|uniref:TetR/AcrR family transcriptional regulator n=1 Tax=Piscicoccus intestinalis TaxID=746033 RepID=UPI0008386E13|nr:TetR/AcrR family transcriptional regulator [Piscicoccus intestinalis]
MTTRRRGKELEGAILAAAWEQFTQGGYPAVTMDLVAERAGTSKPVLYRRWPDRDALLRAAIQHAVSRVRLQAPGTGSLRDDMLALMRQANDELLGIAAAVSAHLARYFADTGTTPAALHASIDVDLLALVQTMYDEAIARGEIDPARLTPRIAALPVDLMRMEIVTRLEPVPQDVIEEIVDTIFLPLVRPAGATG